MSRSSPSLIGLLGTLQRAGLTYAQLMVFVTACQAQHSGPVVFQMTLGRIRSIEVQSPRPKPQLQHD